MFRGYDTFNDAIKAIGTSTEVVEIKTSLKIRSNLTIPRNITLSFIHGGSLNISSGITVTINGHVDTGLYQIFSGPGTVDGNPIVDKIYSEWWGGVADASTESGDAINNALTLAKDNYHTVELLNGTYLIEEPVVIYDLSILEGQGHANTTLKAKNSLDDNVIETDDFDILTGQNKWKTANDVVYGFQLKGFSIDGNKANQSSGYGMKLYAKAYVIDDVYIYNCKEVGFYSECGAAVGQDDWTDEPTRKPSNINVRGCDGNNIHWRGPHDHVWSSIASCHSGGYGWLSEDSSGVYKGGCRILEMHTHNNTSDVKFDAQVTAHELIIEEPVTLADSETVIDYLRCKTTTGTACTIDDSEITIGTLYAIVSGNGGNGVKVTSNGGRAKIGTLQVINKHTTKAERTGIGFEIDTADRIDVAGGSIKTFDGTDGCGFKLGTTAAAIGCKITLDIADCDDGFYYVTQGESNILNLDIYTNSGQKALHTSTQAPKDDDDDFNIFARGDDVGLTRCTVLSSGFAIDAVDTVDVTIAHGLLWTPVLRQCQLTLVKDKDTAVSDFELGWIRVQSTDATNVTAKVNVTTASGTGSATAKLALRARN